MPSILSANDRPTTIRAAKDSGGLVAMPQVRWAFAALLLFAIGALAHAAGAPPAIWWMLYLAAYAAGGWEPALAGVQALRDRTLDVDLLMVAAALLAAAIGQVFEGALLIVIFATSGALEAVVTRRTADSVRALLDVAPERATRLEPDGSEAVIDTAHLQIGDRVLVRPGERIGADGDVVAGTSDVDQASITGEPLPVVKQVGDEVFAGTLNGAGALEVQVNRPAADSVVARIVTLVAQASATKAKRQLFIETVEQRYSVGVVVTTLALFLIPLSLGAAFEPTLLRAMTFMIVASPCAVVLATMPPLLASIANAGRRGLLVKSAVVMEIMRAATVVVFDKTGTLTQGTPRVADVHVSRGSGLSANEIVRLAAAAERHSEHPIATAVVRAAGERGLPVPPAADFSSAPGRGVSALVEGRRVRVGSPRLLDGAGSASNGQDPARAAVLAVEAGGRTAVLVWIDDEPAGVLAIADRLRPGAAETVAALAALTGNCPVLVTGDNPGAARQLAGEVGIADVRAGLLPEDKVREVRALQAQGHVVLLVGDGVNDAPAMAAADLGLAMGRQGSDLALETSDAVIVHDELATIPRAIALSRRAHRVVVANLAIAASVIAVLVSWDILATLPLPLGVAGHEGSTVVVGLNGLRLLRAAAWNRGG